jgi:DNA repair protein RadD
MILRPYQEEAKAAVYQYLRAQNDNPCVVIPTAGGKSPLMAAICADAVGLWQGRVLILAHVRELLVQTADKLRRICPDLKIGIYSAGLKRRDTQEPIILAGIQSVYQRACELDKFDLILVDEAHLIPADGEGMYQTFLTEARKVNPQVRVIGFTATPYRLDSGLICGPDKILTEICYEIGVRELIVQGYLCPLISKAGKTKADTSGLHVRGGEFIPGEVEGLMDQDGLVEAACAEIVAHTHDRQAVLIFASGVQHGQHVARILRDCHGVDCGFICGETPGQERDDLLARFRGDDVTPDGLFQEQRPLKYLVNVQVLTTGFDAPKIDCVALLRPTLSPGLYYQMVGRGFRLHPGKANCLVLDFGGNILRHGPVDQIKAPKSVDGTGNGEAPAKECPDCQSVIAAGYAKCPDCGYEFPPPARQAHGTQASEAGILSGQVTDTHYPVNNIFYSVHTKRQAGPEAPKSLRVDYRVGWHDQKSEWICFEHTGFARQKAEAWWQARTTLPIPATAAAALDVIEEFGILQPKNITVRAVAGEDYERIIGYELPPLENQVDESFDYSTFEIAKEEIPW